LFSVFVFVRHLLAGLGHRRLQWLKVRVAMVKAEREEGVVVDEQLEAWFLLRVD